MIIVIMGVSGSGKSTIAERLAAKLKCKFEDADDFHSDSNKEKMHAGVPLTDQDRQPWLNALRQRFDSAAKQNECLIMACSALKKSYRESFSNAVGGIGDARVSEAKIIKYVYLKADFETIAKRLEKRKHAFMNPDLLKSQFDTLEEPDDAIVVDASKTPDQIVSDITLQLEQV